MEMEEGDQELHRRQEKAKEMGYEAADDSMMLVVSNMGWVDLRFDVFLEYSNTDIHPQMIERYPVQIEMGASSIKSFNLTSPYDNGEANVSITDDIASVSVKSADCSPPCYYCSGVQDIMLDFNIQGLPF